jgi:hypothetical protein
MKRRSRLNKDPKSKILKILIGVLSCILIIGLIYAVFFDGIFSIKKVNISLNDVNCADETQIKQTTNLVGQTILLVNENIIVYLYRIGKDYQKVTQSS